MAREKQYGDPKNGQYNEQYGDPSKPNHPSVNGDAIVAVKKNEQGDIRGFKLESGQILSYDEVRQAVEAGRAEGLIVQKGNAENAVIRSAPDAHKENNLDRLPVF